MKRANKFWILSVRILTFLAGTFLLAFVAAPSAKSEPATGKTLDEIKSLAAKEPPVCFQSSLKSNDVALVLKGFHQQYPEIKVESDRIHGSSSREKILTEALSGVTECDVVDVSSELQAKFVKAGIVVGPIDWHGIFPKIPTVHFSPDGHFVAVGFSTHVIGYNPSLVPKDRVPTKWEDCLDPYWKGKFVVDTRPKAFAGLALDWGEKKILQYAAQLKANQPIWKRGQTESLAELAAGEFPMVCGTYYQSLSKVQREDPKANLAAAFPHEVPASISESMAILKGSKSPNAAILLVGYLSSAQGQAVYDQIGRGSPFEEGGQTWKLVQKAGAKVVFEGWEDHGFESMISKKIVDAWGLTGK